MPEQKPSLRRIARAARWTALRLRVDETLARLFWLLPVPLIYAVLGLTYVKVARPSAPVVHALVYLGSIPVGLVLGGALLAWFKRRPPHAGAHALDRYHGLDDRLASALSFHELPPADQSPLMAAAVDDALTHARDLKPRRAAPLHVPRELPIVALLIAGLVGVALLEVRTRHVLPPEKHFQPMVMSPDDIELFRGMAKDLAKKAQDAKTQAAVRRFNQLIEDIAQHRLDRREVFERLDKLERSLVQGAKQAEDSMHQGLTSVAEELEKAELSKPIATALKQNNLTDAEKAMRKLAAALKRKRKPNQAELKRLREALKKASHATAARRKRLEALRKQYEQEEKRLLKQRHNDAGTNEQQRLLQRKQRQLERLNRQLNQAKQAERQLSRLDRELNQAAQDLMRQAGMSGQDLEQGAQDINRLARQQMSDKQKQELLQRLRELRQLMQQQGKGGKARMMRLVRFGLRARGKQGSGQGQGQQGKGNGKKELIFTPGQNGKTVMIMPGMGGQMPGSSGQGSQGQGNSGQRNGNGAGQGGKQWGTGHDTHLTGKDTSHLKMHTKNVTSAAQDTGQGTASSQVIYGAAQRGFVGQGYQKVYTQYHTVAESVMHHDQIPPGYRFYVQRYFQLIRPRD